MDVPFNPCTVLDDIGQIVDHRRKGKKPMGPEERRKAVMARLISTTFSFLPDEDIFCVRLDHYTSYLCLVINLAAKVYDQDSKSIDPLNQECAREILLQGRRPDEKKLVENRLKSEEMGSQAKSPKRRPIIDDMIAAAPGIGEINIKLVDPKIDKARGLGLVVNISRGMMNVLKSSSMTNSGNINASVRRGYSGNAAHTVGAKILSSRHKNEKGEIKTLLDLLVESRDARQGMISIGVPPEKISSLIGVIDSNADLSNVTAVHPARMKTMFVPIGAGQYVQVTPVPTIARFVEQNSRLRRLGWRVKSSRTQISDKPANASMYALFEDGKIIRLHADFPRQEVYERRAYAIAAGRLPVEVRSISTEAVQEIITLSVTQGGRLTVRGIDQEGYTNVRIRAALDHWISSASSGFLDALLEIVGNVETLVADKSVDVSRAKSYVRHLLNSECGIDLETVRADFVSDAVKTIRGAIAGVGKRKGFEADAAQAIGFTALILEETLNRLALGAFK